MTYYDAKEYADYLDEVEIHSDIDCGCIGDECEPIDLPEEFDMDEAFTDMLDSKYNEVQVFGCSWAASAALYKLDPAAYSHYRDDYEWELLDSKEIVEVD